MDVTEFGRKLKALRNNVGLSLQKMGDIAGFTKSYLSMLENGKVKNIPNPETLKKLSEPLGVPLHELMSMAGYIDNRTMIEEDFSNLNKIGAEIRQANRDISDYEERAKWAEENNETKEGYTAEDFLSERDEILKYLNLLQSRYAEIRQRLTENPKTNDVFEARAREAKKEINIWLYQERFHVQIEDFLKDERKNFYIGGHKLTHKEIKSLITLYGSKKKNYPTDDEIQKEYEAIKKEKIDFEKELNNMNDLSVITSYRYYDVDTNE